MSGVRLFFFFNITPKALQGNGSLRHGRVHESGVMTGLLGHSSVRCLPSGSVPWMDRITEGSVQLQKNPQSTRLEKQSTS